MTRQADTGTHVALAADLLRHMEIRLLDPMEILLAADPGLGARARIAAETLAAQLLGPDPAIAAAAAARVVAALFGAEAGPPHSWWATPTGAAVARRAGQPGRSVVPVATAAAMLGITRQGVHDLVRRGKLTGRPEGGVTTESIMDRMDHLANKENHDHQVR